MLHGLYDAIEDDEAMGCLASTVAQLCGARSANIVYVAPGAPPVQQISYFPPEYVPIYLEHFVARDPWRQQAMLMAVQGRAVPMDDYLPPERFVETAMFNELLKPLGDDTGRCMGMDGPSGGAQLHIAVHRPLNGPEFKVSELRRLEDVFHHVARVLHHRALLDGERSLRRRSEAMIDASQSAVLIVDRNLNVLAASRAAVALLDRGDGLAHRDGRVTIASAQTATAVREAVRGLIDRLPTLCTSFLCERNSGRAAYRLFLSCAGDSGSAGVAVIIDDPSSAWRCTKLALLADAYRFTPAEKTLAEQLIRGSSLDAIAANRAVNIETIRSQLKSIFTKTGTNRQVDLVSLLS